MHRPHSSTVQKRNKSGGKWNREYFERRRLQLLEEEVEAKKAYMEKLIDNDNKKVELLQQIVNKLK